MHVPPPADPPPYGSPPPQQGSIPPWQYGAPPPQAPKGNPALVWIFVGVGVLFVFGLAVTFAIGIALGARADRSVARRGDPPAAAAAPDDTSPAPLATNTGALPPSSLPSPHRNVPVHPESLLDGCTKSDLDLIERRIGAAIDLGAPTYNRGDFEGCFSTYERTARSIETTLPSSCKGPATALAAGRAKAANQSRASDKAWAMRDSFDGLLDVIDRAR